mgnify:CR=1 FL=1
MSDSDDPAVQIREALEAARAGPARLRELCADLDHSDCIRKPGVGKLSLLEHVWHLADMEQNVFGDRLRRVLEEDDPRLEPIDTEEHAIHDDVLEGRRLGDVLTSWEEARARNVALVEATTPEQWRRPVRHPQLGRATFLDVVRRWSRHDHDHLRQIEILALNCRERNLP